MSNTFLYYASIRGSARPTNKYILIRASIDDPVLYPTAFHMRLTCPFFCSQCGRAALYITLRRTLPRWSNLILQHLTPLFSITRRDLFRLERCTLFGGLDTRMGGLGGRCCMKDRYLWQYIFKHLNSHSHVSMVFKTLEIQCQTTS